MARYEPEELKAMLHKYFTKVYTEQHIEQGYEANVGQPVWYGLDGHPKYDQIGQRLGISGDKVKMSFESWISAGNAPPGGVSPKKEANPVTPLQMQPTAMGGTQTMSSPAGGLAETVNTLNQVANLKQAQHNISQISQASMPSQAGGDLGSVVGALASALASPRDDTSSMAMMMQMNQQAQAASAASRDSQDQRFTALLNIMFQQQAQSQTMMMEAMRGGGSRSALEERILNKSVDQMLTGGGTAEDTILTQLVSSGQLPEIGKGLLDGVANVLAARQPPSTEQPTYMSQPQVQQALPQPQVQPVQQVGPQPQPQGQPATIQLSFEQKCDVVMEGFHNNLPDTYKDDLAYIGVLKRQVEIAVRRAEDFNPNDIRQQLIAADKEMHLIVNLRSIAVNINRVASGEVNTEIAAQVLQGLPIFNDHFRGETYESLIAKVEPYAAADPPGQKMFAWDIDFLKQDNAATVIRQILMVANR